MDLHRLYLHSHLYADATALAEARLSTPADAETRYKILIVDDDNVNRMVLKAHLRKQNFELLEAIDGLAALETMKSHADIDLILLDVMMPNMTGYQACEQLRKDHDLQDLPIIFLTANHQPQEPLKAFVAGGNDFMTKPVNATALLEKVRLHLGLLEESRALTLEQTPHTLDLHSAIAKILQQMSALIGRATSLDCWLCDADNHFTCIETPWNRDKVATHLALHWRDLEALTDKVGKRNKNISLAKNLAAAAANGRLGANFVGRGTPHCELIFCDNFIQGFLLLGTEEGAPLLPDELQQIFQCQVYIAAAIAKAQKISCA